MSWWWLGVPILWIAIGAYLLRQSRRVSAWPRAQGTVTGAEFWRNGYYPVVGFRTSDGREWQFRDKIGLPQVGGRSVQTPAVGNEVDVAFDPADPGRARIVTWLRLWGLPVLLLGLGVPAFFLVLAVLVNGGPLQLSR